MNIDDATERVLAVSVQHLTPQDHDQLQYDPGLHANISAHDLGHFWLIGVPDDDIEYLYGFVNQRLIALLTFAAAHDFDYLKLAPDGYTLDGFERYDWE